MSENTSMKFSLIEPAALAVSSERYTMAERLAHSQAVSLKRIADVLTGEGFAQLFMHPINHYGEGVSDAIQNSIERGLRGMNTRG